MLCTDELLMDCGFKAGLSCFELKPPEGFWVKSRTVMLCPDELLMDCRFKAGLSCFELEKLADTNKLSVCRNAGLSCFELERQAGYQIMACHKAGLSRFLPDNPIAPKGCPIICLDDQYVWSTC